MLVKLVPYKTSTTFAINRIIANIKKTRIETIINSPSVSFADSSIGCFATGYTEDASGVGRANSRVNCFAISLAASPPPYNTREKGNHQVSHFSHNIIKNPLSLCRTALNSAPYNC